MGSVAVVVAGGLGGGALVMSANAGGVDLAHQALPAKDGWAASGSGTTGGAQADSAHVFTVSTRAQLVKALGSASDTTPRASLYSINSRAKAQVVAEDNYWKVPVGQKIAKLLSRDGTGPVVGGGNLVDGTATDLVAAYNAASTKKIKTTVNWTPTLTAGFQTSAKNLPAELAGTTGAGVLSQGDVTPSLGQPSPAALDGRWRR
ncbi:hypothetical protein ACFYZE_05170 [Streptomyces sp. NPDC001796]|uniref:hypothetical protein n=1 Tax=Streptomyces sp. NPDC001796 TaxID=3364609 RepID=UPI0036CBD9ED